MAPVVWGYDRCGKTYALENKMSLISAFSCEVSDLSVCNLTMALNVPLLLMCGLFQEDCERDTHNELKRSSC